ncbi:MAG TPA: Holliday junction branch migration protein RuvA [Thermoanaerobaculia bacterium]|nr:Holliday junction branch migration protein RuvA [Thermoanaerobaculia bacterium]
MFDYIEGVVAGRAPARLVLDVGGVGYDLSVPLSSRFPASGKTRAWTHLAVREDAHTLYGFDDRGTRDLFRLLLHVRGVGPTLALSVLSGLPRDPLIAAVADGDVKALTRIRGIGNKTAQQIILDLKDKAAELRARAGAAADPTRATHGAKDSTVEDAVAALVSIGYSEKEARQSVERAAGQVDKKDLERLVRAALVTG